MLFSIENLPYWIFLGSGGVLFVAILSGQTDRRSLSADNGGHANGSLSPSGQSQSGQSQYGLTPNKSDGSVADGPTDVVLPDSPRQSYASFPLRMALTLTLWGSVGWLVNVIIGASLGTMPQGLLGFVVVTITLILALIVSHQMMSPVSWIISSRRKTTSFDPLVGCIGIVSSESLHTMTAGDVAQIEVTDPQGEVLTINAALPTWAKVTPQQGDRVTLIERSEEVHLYYAVASDSPDQDSWLKRTASI
ncbi:MAG: hypothetical protein WBA10_20460 [Elainellaceae cyanobacterium]